MHREITGNGILLPRQYGIRVGEPGNGGIFFNPTNAARGLFALWSPENKVKRMSKWAESQGLHPEETWDTLTKKINRQKGSTILLNMSGNGDERAILESNRLGPKISVKVRSLSGKEPYEPRLSRATNALGNPHSFCTCEDYKHGREKELHANCVHISILQWALKHDKKHVSQKESYTGLEPRNRNYFTPNLPFAFDAQIVCDLVYRSFLNESQAETDQYALDNFPILTTKAHFLLQTPFISREFMVQREQPATLGDTYQESVREIIRTNDELEKEDGFHPAGHSREFVNGDVIVGRRYKPGREQNRKNDTPLEDVPSERVLLVGEHTPPLVLEKRLGIYTNKRPNQGMRYIEEGVWQEIIDDATRRHAEARVVRPEVYAQSLEPIYDKFFEGKLF